MSNKAPRVVVVSGPTASGKTTLWRRLVQNPGIDFSVSVTTRPPREGEAEGVDYRFLERQEFDELIEQGALLEYAVVHGQSYGTLKSEVAASLEAGRHVVLEIDVNGARQVRESGFPQVSFFIQPPSIEVLVERLKARGTEGPEEMNRRLEIVGQELAQAESYDYVVVNDDLEAMIEEVETLLGLRGEA